MNENDPELIRWHRIESGSYVNGPGRRTVVWLTGCPVRCPGCQNRALWRESAETKRATPRQLAIMVQNRVGGEDLTVTGGEPFYQPEQLFLFLSNIRQLDLARNRSREILVYSGYTWDDLLDLAEAIPSIVGVLAQIDVLVDGPYLADQDDDAIQWRGSRNQRAIDVPASIANGALNRSICAQRGDAGADDRLVLLDWDTPVITLAPGGQLIGAAGLIRDLALDEDGATAPTARCGQVSDHLSQAEY